MPEETSPAGAPVVAREPFEVPSEIGTETWQSLFPNEQPAAEEAAPAPAEPVAVTPEPAASEPEDEPVPDARTQAHSMVEEMIPRIAAEMAARQQQGQTAAASRADIKDQIIEELVTAGGEGADKGAITHLVETMVKVAEGQTAPRIQQLEQQIAALAGAQQRQQSEAVLRQFSDRIGALCQEAGIVSAFDRNAMEALVVKQGLAKYGGQFDMAKAERTFREINSERIRGRHGETVQQTQAKVAASAAEPPVKAATGNASAAESIRYALAHPRETKTGLGSRRHNRLVTEYIDALGKGVNKALG